MEKIEQRSSGHKKGAGGVWCRHEQSFSEREQLLEDIRKSIIDEIDMSRELSDGELKGLIDKKIDRALPVRQRLEIRKAIFASFRGLDVIQDLIDDEDVTEIMVNGSRDIYYEKDGKIRKWNRSFSSREKLEDIVQQIVSKVNRAVNTASPIVDARLLDGSRVSVVLPPIAPEGPILTIRRFSRDPMTMKRLIDCGSITAEAAEFLRELVVGGYNIFISGGTGSGKTTFLNALSGYIPAGERVITIEDSLELQLKAENLVRLETRNANADGEGEITIRDLIKSALRMRPDRLIVGEVRGAETLDMLQAMNTGHDGSLSTGHGNNPKDMLSRLETMVLMGEELPLPAIRAQIGSALDVIVHLGRLPDGSRKVLLISEVLGYEDGEVKLQNIYVRHEGSLERQAEFKGAKRRIC